MITVESIAAMCYRVNKAVCEAAGDHSQPTWENAPDWQKESMIDGVLSALTTMDPTPQQNHKNWVDYKLADGWVRGDVKDPVKKTHPCLVPFVDLPIEQKIKDYVFLAVVEGMAALVPEDRHMPGLPISPVIIDTVASTPSVADVDAHPIEEGASVSVGSEFVDEASQKA